MRPPDTPPPPADQAYLARLGAVAETFGITHWGVAPAGVMHRARAALVQRHAAGLDDSMQFTYRNPIRSTDPGAAVRGARSVFVGALPYDGGDGGGGGDAVSVGGEGGGFDGGQPSPGRTGPTGTTGTTGRPGTPRSRLAGTTGSGLAGTTGSGPTGTTGSGLVGEVGRYARADYTGRLRTGLNAVAAQLRADRWKAVAFADDNSLVDRELAHLAGLGWFGKNANILVSGAGSWFVLGSVVTTADLPVATEPAADGCGTCERCIVACPTNAIVAPGVIDARRCLSWILQRPGAIPDEFRAAIGRRIYGCDDCQTSCPPTVVFGRRGDRLTSGTGNRGDLDLMALLEMTDEELISTWGRWYLADRDPRWIRRNAIVAAGNALAADASLTYTQRCAAVAVLERYVDGIDPLLADHARWAMRRAEGDA